MLNQSGMPKKAKLMIQTKLSFSSSDCKSTDDNETTLKRKIMTSRASGSSDFPVAASRASGSSDFSVAASRASGSSYRQQQKRDAGKTEAEEGMEGAVSSIPLSNDWMKEKAKDTEDEGAHRKGVSINALPRAPYCYRDTLPRFTASSWRSEKPHIVLFHAADGWKWREQCPIPFGNSYKDSWDNHHVRMPCSVESEIPVFSEEKLHTVTEKRWKCIEDKLKQPILDVFTLKQAILSYNSHYKDKWGFSCLIEFCEKELSQKERDIFFGITLPEMQRLARNLPNLITRAVPLLKRGKKASLSVSQEQLACLLANAFFCTFPRRNRQFKFTTLADINFSGLFNIPSPRKFEKLKCIFNYFNRIASERPKGVVTFTRQVLDPLQFHKWKRMKCKLTNIHVSAQGTIEDDGRGMLQADFANKYVGGGVLGHGCVQEEIRFSICPEMIVSRLFTEVLDHNEVLIMKGCERFSNYTGYTDSFRYDGDHVDRTPRDEWGRRETEVVAMDALVIRRYASQFEEDSLTRELNKAYCAFHQADLRLEIPAVCTGNWGCGAFGGDKQLKALIQLIAASVAKRDVCYFTFGEVELRDQIVYIHQLLKVKANYSVGSILEHVTDYYKGVLSHCLGSPKYSLFEYIADCLGFVWPFKKVENGSEDPGNGDQPYDAEFDEEIEDYKANTP